MKKRKTLLIDFGVPFGGAEVYLTHLVQLLSEKAEFFALGVNPRLCAALNALNVRVFGFPRFLHAGKAVHFLIGIVMLVWIRLRYNVSTIWIQGVPENALLPIARMLGCETLSTQHFALNPSLSRNLYPYFARFAQKIICVSRAVQSDIAPLLNGANLVAIPNWVSIPQTSVDVSYQKGQPLRLLFVGRLEKHKGVDLVLQAMRSLREARPESTISLTVVGEGYYRPELEQLANGLNVEFVGFNERPSQYFATADIFINPSRGAEGMPLASLEAMASGMPCILSDLPVHKEITDDGQYAVLFHCGDENDLQTKIESLLTSPHLMKRIGRSARETVLRLHTPDAARAAYLRELQFEG